MFKVAAGVIAGFCLSSAALAQFAGGSGTISDPYTIETPAQFAHMSGNSAYWSSSFELVNDIDLSGYDGQDGNPAYDIMAADTDPDSPGFQGTAFTGRLNGAGHKITNLHIAADNNDYTGLIGYIGYGGNITNLEIADAVITNAGSCCGILAGQSSGSVIGCQISGNAQGYEYIGGLIGYSQAGSIENCQGDVQVNGRFSVGGLLGCNDGGSIYNSKVFAGSHITGETSSNNIGGLVGYNKGELNSSSSRATVTGVNSTYVGGLVGYIEHSNVVKCFADADVVSSGSSLYIGGLVGYGSTIDFEECYSRGDVTAESSSFVGGLIGYGLNINVLNAYSWGDIAGMNYVGGLFGFNDFGTAYYTYSAGAVSGSAYVGGYVGCNKYGNLYYSLWDSTRASGVSFTAGANIGGELDTVYAKRTDQMEQYLTFAEVRFDIRDMLLNGTDDIWQRDTSNLLPVFTWQDDAMLFSGGSGTEEDPFLIATALDLYRIADYKWEYYGSHYRQAADIDMIDYDGLEGRKAYRIIGDNEYFTSKSVGKGYVNAFYFLFSGAYDGAGYTISNLSIERLNDNYSGMVGVLTAEGELKNIALEGCRVNAYQYTGAIAGQSEGVVSGCTVDVDMTAQYCSGGVVGYNKGTISDCSCTGSIETESNNIGGVAGSSNNLIENCSTSITVNAHNRSGGIVGENNGSVINCHSEGVVNGWDNVGGVAGWSYSVVDRCSSVVSVDGASNTGGVIGYNEGRGVITSCFSQGTTAGTYNVGGLAGINYGTVNNCYSTNDIVTGSTSAGAAFGSSSGIVSNCYTAGSGLAGNIRGFAGSLSGTYSNCYWDSEIAGVTNGVGGTGDDPVEVVALGTAEMMQRASFAGFDFIGDEDGTDDLWSIREGYAYPRLTWQPVAVGDIAGSYAVDSADIYALAGYWLTEAGDPEWNKAVDIVDDNRIDLLDLAAIAVNWLK